MKTFDLPLIPTTVVGSHGKTSWWTAGVRLFDEGRWGPFDVEEMLASAVDGAVRDMEDAGIDVLTDGEMRRLDGYVDSYYRVIRGLEAIPIARKDGPWGYDQQERFRAVGTIETPPGGLGIVKEWSYARGRTDKILKATCAGPLTFGSRILPGHTYGSVVQISERFAEVINQELKGLVAAGAEWIQLDEPARTNVTGAEMARLFNLATEGVNAKLGFHVCFGNRYGRGRFKRSYRPLFPGLLDTRCDQFVLEFASRELSEIDLWKEYGGDRELAAGVVDVKSFYPETPEDVADRARALLTVCRPEKLSLCPDCGFGWSPRNMAVGKLQALAAGAKIIRKELAG